MRVIPVENLVVEVTVEQLERHGETRWRGHWSIHPSQAYRQREAVAEGDTDEVYTTEEHAYLFAGTAGVAAKEIAAKFPGHRSRRNSRSTATCCDYGKTLAREWPSWPEDARFSYSTQVLELRMLHY